MASLEIIMRIVVLGTLIFGAPVGILLFLIFGNPSKEFLDALKDYNPPGWE